MQNFSGGLALTAGGGINLVGTTLQTGGAQTFNSAVNVLGPASLISTGRSHHVRQYGRWRERAEHHECRSTTVSTRRWAPPRR
jgi:hypothetical protein